MYKIKRMRTIVTSVTHVTKSMVEDLSERGYDMISPNTFLMSLRSFTENIKYKLDHHMPIEMTVFTLNNTNNILMEDSDDDEVKSLIEFMISYRKDFGVPISIAKIDNQLVSIRMTNLSGMISIESDLMQLPKIKVKSIERNIITFDARMTKCAVNNNWHNEKNIAIIGLLWTEEI